VPKINEASKKLIEGKQKSEGTGSNPPVHMRLYNKRNQNMKNELLKNSPSDLGSKVNMSKKLEERTTSLYQDAAKRQIKQKEIENLIIKSQNDANKIKSSVNSNRVIFKRFKGQFRDEVEKILNQIVLNKEEENVNVNANVNENNFNKLNFVYLATLMQNLGFISNNKNEDISGGGDMLSNDGLFLTKNQEKKLLVDLYDNLKDNDGYVNLDHLFIFCLSILNLLEYYVVKTYKVNEEGSGINNFNGNGTKSQKTLKSSSSNPRIIQKTNSQLTLNEEATQNLIHKLNLDLNNRIVIHRKYGGLDEENNFIISFSHSKLIFKDFTIFSINWSSSFKAAKREKANLKLQENEMTFKPNINPKSVHLSNKYRQRVMIQMEQINNNNNIDPQLEISPKNNNGGELDYIQIVNLKKQKQEKINAKIREEKEIKELEKCTFKPKINNYTFRDNIFPVDSIQKDQRIERLHRIGTESIINKKNKTKDDIEIEKYGKECTFKPNINERDFAAVFDGAKQEMNHREYNDVQKFNERMKRGRIEKEIKESAFKRGEEFMSPRKYEEKRTMSENKFRMKSPERNEGINTRNAIMSPMRKINSTNSNSKNNNDTMMKYQQYLSQNISNANNSKTQSNSIKSENSKYIMFIISNV
jgi:hypothetical protein